MCDNIPNMNIFGLFKKNINKDLKSVAEKELKENIEVFESLRDYDQGKKDISTSKIERNLRDLETTT